MFLISNLISSISNRMFGSHFEIASSTDPSVRDDMVGLYLTVPPGGGSAQYDAFPVMSRDP